MKPSQQLSVARRLFTNAPNNNKRNNLNTKQQPLNANSIYLKSQLRKPSMFNMCPNNKRSNINSSMNNPSSTSRALQDHNTDSDRKLKRKTKTNKRNTM